MTKPDRKAQIESLLAQSPNDTFLLYGLAMEYLKEGNAAEGIARLKHVADVNPNYPAAYFQLGQILSQQGETDEARDWLTRGVTVAQKIGDHHAAGEMEQFLMML
ncbi:MAG: tetratricopeptide repeat protein [Planctomycetota bacterium]